MSRRFFLKTKPLRYFKPRWWVFPLYSLPGGKICTVSEVGLRTFSGFAVNTPAGCVWLYFRRGTNA